MPYSKVKINDGAVVANWHTGVVVVMTPCHSRAQKHFWSFKSKENVWNALISGVIRYEVKTLPKKD